MRPTVRPSVRRSVMVCVLALCGCTGTEGSGEVAIKEFPVRDFDRVVLSGAGTVTLHEGDYAVSVSAERELLPSIRVEQEGDALVLSRDIDWFDGVRATVPIEFRVSLPTLAGVRVTGAGQVLLRDAPVEAGLALSVSGAGKIDVADAEVQTAEIDVQGAGTVTAAGLVADSLNCDLSGAGRITLAGAAKSLSVSLSGAGLFRAEHVRAERATVDVTGAGQAFVWVEQHLAVSVNGAGRVSYRGQPTIDQDLQRDGALVRLDSAEP